MSRNRIRTSAGPTYATATWKYARSAVKPFIPPVEYETLVAHSYETITDHVSQSFYKSVAAGEVIINPVSHVKTSINCVGAGSYHWTRTNGRIYHEDGPCLTAMQIARYPNYMGGFIPEPEVPWDMDAAAKLHALGSVDRAPYSFAEDIAEMRETLRFLKNPLKTLRTLSDQFDADVIKKMNAARALKRADAIADVWLQYQFAFLPLVRSANDAVTGFFDKVKRPKRRTARGVSHFRDSQSDSRLIATWRSAASTTVDKTVRAGIIYEVSNPLNDWKFKYGLRFKDIPETMWAIFPYSFMVDRVLNLSQTVRGLTAFLDPNVEMLGAWASEKTMLTQTEEWLGHESDIVQSVEKAETDAIVQSVDSYSRTVWEPTFSDLVPPLRLSELVSSSSKIADLAALIWARVR